MDEVPQRIRVFYGLGSVAEGTKDTAFNIFLLFFYNNVLGLSGSLSGLAIFLALCVDALSDPALGSISDNTRTRWGRRHPYMYAAAIPMALAVVALFNPPAGLDQIGLFAWLTGFAIATRLAMTFYSVPSNAMVPEMTEDYDERTVLIGYRFLFGWLAGLIVAILGYLVFFAEQADGRDGRLVAAAYQDFGWLCAVTIAAGILTCAAGTHRIIPALKVPDTRPGLSLRGFFGELRAVFANRSFRMLFFGALFSAAGWGYINAISFYMNTYFWQLSTDQIGLLTLSLFPAVIFAFLLAPMVSAFYDKKAVAVGLSIFAFFFGPLPIFLHLAGWFFAAGSQDQLALLFFHTLILFTALISVSILTASMIGDVTDESELATGQRQEGLFAAVIAFTLKATAGFGMLLAGLALDWIAFPRQQSASEVSADKVAALGTAVGPGIMLLFALSVVFLSRYRISRERHQEVLAALAGRD